MQARIFGDLLFKEDGRYADFDFYFGNAQDLATFRNQIYPEMPRGKLEAGQTWFPERVALITNKAPETVLHEMLHMHTYETLVDYYRNPRAAGANVRYAVRQLEGLAQEVMGLKAESQALRTLQSELIAYENQGNPAARISELISYMLSNQELIETGKKTRTYRAMTSIVRKGLDLLKRLLGLEKIKTPGNDLFSNIRFNTELMLSQRSERTEAVELEAELDQVLYQRYGRDARLEDLEARYLGRLHDTLAGAAERASESLMPDEAEAVREAHDLKVAELRRNGLVKAELANAQGFRLNKREGATFSAKARDPEMSSTKKGNAWYFGMKAHVGVDADSGIVHSLETTTAKVHDSQVWDELLHGREKSIWADKGYVSASREAAFSGPGKFWGVMRKAPKGGALHPIDEDINRIIAMVRARVEHPFRVIKRQFGYVKTRYRGLAKNRTQLLTLFALGNLFLVRRKLLA